MRMVGGEEDRVLALESRSYTLRMAGVIRIPGAAADSKRERQSVSTSVANRVNVVEGDSLLLQSPAASAADPFDGD